MKKLFGAGIFLLLAGFLAPLTGQQQAVKIGQPIPDKIWQTPLKVLNHPQNAGTITLAKDKGKLIILDFWNTWCSACLKGFPKMEQLQQKFGDRIRVVAVSSQDRATLQKFFESKNGQRFKKVTTVTDDTLFTKMFPHLGVPFIVWIKDGKLLNTTDGDQVSEQSIAAVLDDDNAVLQTVVQRDYEGPLMLAEDFRLEKGFELNQYSFFGKGRLRSIGFGSRFHRSGNEVRGRQFTNLSLFEIYSIIADEIFRDRQDIFSSRRIVAEVKDLKSLKNEADQEGKVDDAQLYSFDFMVPPSQSKKLYPAMLSNLNQFSEYEGAIEKRPVPCLVLTQSAKSGAPGTKGGAAGFLLNTSGATLRNATMYDFVNSLNGIDDYPLPIVDETHFTGNIDLSLGNISTVELLKKELSRYGLELTESERRLDMLIIRDKAPMTRP